ncbi:MAG: 3-methylcrotonyl-CoA carboxylase beta subunit [Thermomicrobiales bacterium]|jgi:acetyl-CoA carboxylase carboxyltransferase component|nr:3-methylcrotonyl-CoA carboxylase beta subunit [Thermomicrobiales bacterium]
MTVTQSLADTADRSTNVAAVAELHERLASAAAGGGEAAQAKQRARGKLPVRGRIERVLDPASPFLELSPLAAEGMYDGASPGAGIVTGIGRIGGREVVVVANDPTVKGGTYFPMTVKKHLRAQEIALANRLPCLYLVDSGGAFLPLQSEVFPDKDHFGRIFRNQAVLSAHGVRQVAVVLGSCTAGGAYVPAMCDEAVIVRGAGTIFLAGPPLVKAATGEEVSAEELGGADVHGRISGVVDYVAEDETEALALGRDLMSAPRPAPPPIPWQRETIREPEEDPEDLLSLVPTDPRHPYDVRGVLRRVLDGSKLREFKADYGQTLVCAFGHLYGIPVGVIANNGILFPESARKGAHFVMLCAQQRIPLLFFQNITGFIVGRKYEHEGVARDGAKMVAAVAVAQVPKITVMIGASYGAGNYAMCGRAYDPRFVFSWPSHRIAVMGGEQAAGVLTDIRRQSATARGVELDENALAAIRQEVEARYAEEASPYYATARLWDDGIIDPRQTRQVVGLALATTLNAPIPATEYGVLRV